MSMLRLRYRVRRYEFKRYQNTALCFQGHSRRFRHAEGIGIQFKTSCGAKRRPRESVSARATWLHIAHERSGYLTDGSCGLRSPSVRSYSLEPVYSRYCSACSPICYHGWPLITDALYICNLTSISLPVKKLPSHSNILARRYISDRLFNKRSLGTRTTPWLDFTQTGCNRGLVLCPEL